MPIRVTNSNSDRAVKIVTPLRADEESSQTKYDITVTPGSYVYFVGENNDRSSRNNEVTIRVPMEKGHGFRLLPVGKSFGNRGEKLDYTFGNISDSSEGSASPGQVTFGATVVNDKSFDGKHTIVLYDPKGVAKEKQIEFINGVPLMNGKPLIDPRDLTDSTKRPLALRRIRDHVNGEVDAYLASIGTPEVPLVRQPLSADPRVTAKAPEEGRLVPDTRKAPSETMPPALDPRVTAKAPEEPRYVLDPSVTAKAPEIPLVRQPLSVDPRVTVKAPEEPRFVLAPGVTAKAPPETMPPALDPRVTAKAPEEGRLALDPRVTAKVPSETMPPAPAKAPGEPRFVPDTRKAPPETVGDGKQTSMATPGQDPIMHAVAKLKAEGRDLDNPSPTPQGQAPTGGAPAVGGASKQRGQSEGIV